MHAVNFVLRLDDRDNRVVAAPTRVAAIRVFESLAEAEAPWRELERGDVVATPYQRFEWLSLWQTHIGLRHGVAPFLVTGFDPAGKPLFLLPLGLRSKGPVVVASFLGGKHTNLNMGLWRRDFAQTLTDIDLHAIVALFADSGRRVDLLALLNQPERWSGVANPFALFPHQHSAEHNHLLTLGQSGDEVLARLFSSQARGKLRTKERKLARLSGYRYTRATTAADVDRYLTAFFAQKAARLRALGLANVFAEPCVEAFIRAGCDAGIASGRPLFEIHVLEADGEVLAVFAGVQDGRRFCSMFNSYTLSDHARWSPGTLLLLHLVADCADRGLESFDLGLGKADYKALFCKETEVLFDSFVPLTRLGRAAALTARSAFAIKGRIKASPRLWPLVQAARRRLPR
jgi:CelD/BcsL family acetyltransferase involved in cellulose biosynthesis